jgi:hypothetical protein
MSETKCCWIKKHDGSKKKFWGDEREWTGVASTVVKMIHMNMGNRTSFKYNQIKNELFVCVTGSVKAYFGDQSILSTGEGDLSVHTLMPGEALVVQSDCPYRLEAIENSVLIEVSSGTGGCIRLHDDYGREVKFVNDHVENIIAKFW